MALARTPESARAAYRRHNADAILVARHHHLLELATGVVWIVTEPAPVISLRHQRTRRTRPGEEAH